MPESIQNEYMTDTDIRVKGMQTLIEGLGFVNAERFIMLINREPFDYTEWRKNNLEDAPVRVLSNAAIRDYKKK